MGVAMDQLVISCLAPEEIEPLIALAHRIWHAHYPAIITVEQIDYMLSRGYTPEVIRHEMAQEGIIWLTIKASGEMIGFASVGPYGEGIMKLHKLYLLPERHGQGIGARALEEVNRIARETHAHRLVLNVNKHNTVAIKAYRRAGWQVIEEVVADIGNGFVMDDFVMSKQVSRKDT